MITGGSAEIRALPDQAGGNDLIVRLDDGNEFMLSAIEEALEDRD